MLISKSGWDDLDNIAKDLTHNYDSNYNIVAVRRPRVKHECSFCAFEHNFGELIYDRNKDEAVEMSLEEVCAALGKILR